ncbi:aminoglycoside phosphotransferase family protein [Micromonospora endolithica]|uniref:Aminoglycoside phosphotransferase family protein n=1 Tax=Micromonospora endolithica TaxID=230091 RepID=A0A3A9YXE1_9ACTN|nr:aminoglycoside phosphotransferase family protein [Micromonospora endolithica]RKN40703.1 aminoglycoside phosphotransferase family protein [Micromonospora endolithica]
MEIDVALVRRLVARQFPRWAHLPVRPVAYGGWDNRTFHLGADLTVRLPSAAGYALQVGKEQRWLPFLASRLPLPVPVPVAAGAPDEDYPWPWSVRRWIDGDTAAVGRVGDTTAFAVALAGFLTALRDVEATDGPGAGPHSAGRGGPLTSYEEDTRRAVDALGDRIPSDAVLAIWEAALAARWTGPPVWFHGDVAPGNLLVRDGRLAAVIDFGCCGVGDPACDTVIAWTFLAGSARAAFRRTLGVDDATWARGRGWALWKSLITYDDPAPVTRALARRTLDALLDEGAAGRAGSA